MWDEETAWRDIYDKTGYAKTGCGKIQYFSEVIVKENSHKLCPYCGKEIEEVKE